ncbi:hypothetical protein OKW30_006182 [Paraburkholderia sp. Clong3]
MTTAQNDRAIEPQAQHELDETGREQHVDQNVVELHQEAYDRPPLLALREAVRPIGGQPPGRFRCIEALRGIDVELPFDVTGRHRMPRRRTLN